MKKLFVTILAMSLLAGCEKMDKLENAPADGLRASVGTIADYSSEDQNNTGSDFTYTPPELPAQLWSGYSTIPSNLQQVNNGYILQNVEARSQFGPKVGYYGIWYAQREYTMNIPVVNGGQIQMQWKELVPVQRGVYDWAKLDRMLQAYYDKKIYCTLQVNGNEKPTWMFDIVPYIAGEQLDTQVKDSLGTLMYWHPNHIACYRELLAALGTHLSASPYKDVLLGLRYNSNAIGTEKLVPPASYKKSDGTVINTRTKKVYYYPPGTSQNDILVWSEAIRHDYEAAVFEEHMQSLSFLNIFVRNDVSDDIFNENLANFNSGSLSWFQTSSEPEPRGPGGEKKTLRFHDFSRNGGKTLSYAEEWADPWGRHGNKQDPHFCEPAQWNYWRILCDLNAGVSYIAMYGNVWNVALGKGHPANNTIAGQQLGIITVTPAEVQELRRGIEFGYKYMGYHDRPGTAPGAFVAMRNSTVNQSILEGQQITPVPDGYGGSYVLASLTQDYTMLAVRQSDNSQEMKLVGTRNHDNGQRYGAFARKLPQGGQMKVVLHPKLVQAMCGKAAKLRVIYYDEGAGQWSVTYGTNTFSVTNAGTDRWEVAEWDVTGAVRVNPLSASSLIEGGRITGRTDQIGQIDELNPDIVLTAVSGNPVFHMVEIDRSGLFPDMYL